MKNYLKTSLTDILLFLGAILVFGIGVLITRPLGSVYINYAPINYAYTCERYIADGQPQKVPPLVETWIKKHYYDFRAHYYEAEAYSKMGKPDVAYDVISQILQKLPAARARNYPLSGFNEAKTYECMARYRWDEKKYILSAELACIAYDAGAKEFIGELLSIDFEKSAKQLDPYGKLALARMALKAKQKSNFITGLLDEIQTQDPFLQSRIALMRADMFESSKETTKALTILRETVDKFPAIPAPKIALGNLYTRSKQQNMAERMYQLAEQTTGTRVIGLSKFEKQHGMSLSNLGLYMTCNAVTNARNITTGVYRVSNLTFNAEGKSAFGIAPIVVIETDEQEVARVYLDGSQPHLFDASLWPEGASKKLDFTVSFINDIWEPITKGDRNVLIKNILIY